MKGRQNRVNTVNTNKYTKLVPILIKGELVLKKLTDAFLTLRLGSRNKIPMQSSTTFLLQIPF
jgi:hypothetical protein